MYKRYHPISIIYSKSIHEGGEVREGSEGVAATWEAAAGLVFTHTLSVIGVLVPPGPDEAFGCLFTSWLVVNTSDSQLSSAIA